MYMYTYVPKSLDVGMQISRSCQNHHAWNVGQIYQLLEGWTVMLHLIADRCYNRQLMSESPWNVGQIYQFG